MDVKLNSLSNFLHEVLDQLVYYYYMLAKFASTLPWGLELLEGNLDVIMSHLHLKA